MKSKLKILSIVGTRPEVIKMAPVILELSKHPGRIESVVVSTDTVIRGMDDMMRLGDVKIGEWITVIGAPNESGQIGARFIRVFTSSSSLPMDGN